MRRIRELGLVLCLLCTVLNRAARADDAQATQLGQALQAAIMSQDQPGAVKLMDLDGLLDRVMTGITAPAGFTRAFRQQFKQHANLLQGLIDDVARGDTYKFLSVRHINGETRVLCRLLGKRTGLNYHDWVVATDATGAPKLADYYSALTGEMTSENLRRIYVLGALRANLGHGIDQNYVSSVQGMGEMTRDINTRKFSDALDVYKTMEPVIQQRKPVMVMRVIATEGLRKFSPQDFHDAVDDFRATFPGDPSIDLVLSDAMMIDKQYDEYRQSIARLQRFTGGDSYLLVLRGNSYLNEGERRIMPRQRRTSIPRSRRSQRWSRPTGRG